MYTSNKRVRSLQNEQASSGASLGKPRRVGAFLCLAPRRLGGGRLAANEPKPRRSCRAHRCGQKRDGAYKCSSCGVRNEGLCTRRHGTKGRASVACTRSHAASKACKPSAVCLLCALRPALGSGRLCHSGRAATAEWAELEWSSRVESRGCGAPTKVERRDGRCGAARARGVGELGASACGLGYGTKPLARGKTLCNLSVHLDRAPDPNAVTPKSNIQELT